MKNPLHWTAPAAGKHNADTQPLDLAHAAATPASGSSGPATDPVEPTDEPKRRSRKVRWSVVAGVTAVGLVAGVGVGYAVARKTVTLDVDGKVTTVTTFAGSVNDLLDDEGIDVERRDLVVPAPGSKLTRGAEVVVRHGREVTVQADGKTADVWTTALDADEALDTLKTRGKDVRLVASRSKSDGRPALPLRLDTNAPINLVADGKTTVVPHGTQGIDVILDSAQVTLGDLDRVSVRRDPKSTPHVSLVVQRVVVKDVPSTTPVAFKTVTKEDASRYEDAKPKVTQVGVAGVQTVVSRITTVDGVEESRTVLSDKVTTAPVDQIEVKGTKKRPAETTPATGAPAAGGAAPAGVWAALAQCESGGNPASVSANGKYHGLYQFSVSTWQAMGGTGLPSQASAAEQTKRAQALQARSGWGQWPACSRKLGLR